MPTVCISDIDLILMIFSCMTVCVGELVSLFPAIRQYSSVLIASSLCTSGSVTPCNHMPLSAAGVFYLLSLFVPLLSA